MKRIVAPIERVLYFGNKISMSSFLQGGNLACAKSTPSVIIEPSLGSGHCSVVSGRRAI